MQRPNHWVVREISEAGIKIKLSFMREERYFGSISQLFYYHWVSSLEFLKTVQSEIATLHFLAKDTICREYIFKNFFTRYDKYSAGI